MFDIMNLEATIREIRICSDQMNARYGSVVFDEWAIISLINGKAALLNYHGPRLEGFQKNFVMDAAGLRTSSMEREYSVGDFDFARQEAGTGFESFMVLGQGVYLICNNTTASMDMITKNPAWLGAQVPFLELSEKFRGTAMAAC
jgi:hypothetical protein